MKAIITLLAIMLFSLTAKSQNNPDSNQIKIEFRGHFEYFEGECGFRYFTDKNGRVCYVFVDRDKPIPPDDMIKYVENELKKLTFPNSPNTVFYLKLWIKKNERPASSKSSL